MSTRVERKALKTSSAPRCLLQLLHRALHIRTHLLNIVIHAIQQRALVNHEAGQVLEHVCEVGDRLGNVVDLVGALVNGGGRGGSRRGEKLLLG